MKSRLKMCNFIAVVFFVFLSFLSRATAMFPVIKGNDDFCGKVRDALTLMEQKTPATLQFVNTFVKVIQMYNVTGMCVACTPPTYQVIPKPENLEKYWLASTIAHDSYHSYLYQWHKYNLRGAEPPYDSFSGFDAERQCNDFQLTFLISANAPESMIAWMRKQDGKHCDMNNDGKCDEADFQIRQQEIKNNPAMLIQVTEDSNRICPN